MATRGQGSRERTRWNRLALTWDTQAGATRAFELIRERLMTLADAHGTDRVLDLGAGTGFLAMPIAATGASVVALDLSEAMLAMLERRAREFDYRLEPVHGDLRAASFPDRSFTLVVSNYVLHHLSDEEKHAIVRRCFRWLDHGGRLVFADMMFSTGLRSARDRRIVASKVRRLIRRGPAGAWRILKNVWRFALARRERPAPPEFWVRVLQEAGFVDVHVEEPVGDAGIVWARRPVPAQPQRPLPTDEAAR